MRIHITREYFFPEKLCSSRVAVTLLSMSKHTIATYYCVAFALKYVANCSATPCTPDKLFPDDCKY